VTGYLAEHEADMITALRQAPALGRAVCRQTAEGRFSARRMVDQHRLAKQRGAAALGAEVWEFPFQAGCSSSSLLGQPIL
jgi:hypothetical protein